MYKNCMFLIVVFGLMFIHCSYGQKQVIDSLKAENLLLRQRIKQADEYNKEIKSTIETSFSLKKQELEHQNNRNLLAVISVTLVAAITAAINFFGLKNKINDIVNARMIDSISKFLEVRRENFEALIKLYEKEINIKSNKRILVLSENTDKEYNLKKLFKSFGFENSVSYDTIHNSFNTNSFDIIVFNNEDGSMDLELCKKAIVPNRKILYYYYNTTMVPLKIEHNKEIRLSFSNSSLTFYRNLMDAILSHEALEN